MVAILSLLIVCAPDDASSIDGANIIAQRCVRCHNADKSRGGLDLSTREAALAGGSTMDALVPGDLEKSGVYLRAKEHSMPPPKDARPLADTEVTALAQWIKAGAPWPEANERSATSNQQSPPPQAAIRNARSAISACRIAVDSKSRRLRRWRRYGNVAPPLPQVALRPRRR